MEVCVAMKHFISFTLLTVLTANQVVAQDWGKYEPRSLKQITTKFAKASLKDPDVLITDGKGGSIILTADLLCLFVAKPTYLVGPHEQEASPSQ